MTSALLKVTTLLTVLIPYTCKGTAHFLRENCYCCCCCCCCQGLVNHLVMMRDADTSD